MILFIAAAVLIGLPVFTVLDLKRSQGRLKRVAKTVNIALYALAAAALVLGLIAFASRWSSGRKYLNYKGASLVDRVGIIHYERTEGDYYIFQSIDADGYFPTEEFAVPKSAVKLSAISKIYPELIIYTDPNGSSAYRDLPSGRYDVWENAVQIIPDFVPLLLEVFIGSIVLLFIFDLVIYIILISKKE